MSYKINMTPGPWQVAKFSEGHADALPEEVAIFAPNHPDSKLQEDGTWHGVTICRGMTGAAKDDNATVIALVPDMLETLKIAYRKHHLNDASIGWDELSDRLADVLSNAMGPDGFVEWLQEVANND
jgi:hypothetical protein